MTESQSSPTIINKIETKEDDVRIATEQSTIIFKPEANISQAGLTVTSGNEESMAGLEDDPDFDKNKLLESEKSGKTYQISTNNLGTKLEASDKLR